MGTGRGNTGISQEDVATGRGVQVLSGAQDLVALSVRGKPARAIIYSGACTIVDGEGNSRALIDTGGYFLLPVAVKSVTSAANSYMVLY
jgi:hypothetical protein